MLEEALAYTAAAGVMFLVVCIPGAVLGFVSNAARFRERSAPVQLSLSLMLSMAVCPISVYLLARFGGFRAAWIAYGGVWAVAAALSARHRKGLADTLKQLVSNRAVLYLIAGWFVVCGLSEIDLESAHAVFLNLNTIDGIAHVAFTNAITRTGIPPVNPFVYPAHPVHLFYYYLWYLLCSMADQLGGSLVTARAAVQAGTFYVGLGVAAAIAAYAEIAGPQIIPVARKIRTRVALTLLLVTGLDLIPWFFLYAMKAVFDKGSGAGASIEWWNEQVTAWLGAILMSPHHPAGMVICFTAVLMLIMLMQGASGGARIWLLAIAALAMGSAAGVSLYVTFALGAGLAIWAAVSLSRGWWSHVRDLATVAVGAVVLYAPLARELKSSASLNAFPLALTVRAFDPVDYWLPSIFHFLKTTPAAVYALRAVFLPVNYFFELGFFLIAALFYWRWRRSQGTSLAKEEILFACLAAGSILVCTFLRSTFRWNDLGWRGFLIAQFVLLFWAVPVLEDLQARGLPGGLVIPRWRNLAWFCLVLGVSGTVWELVSFRINTDQARGPETVSLRDAYVWIDRHMPQDTIVLFNSDVPADYFSSLYGFRQVVSSGRNYGTFFATGPEAEQVMDDDVEAFHSSDAEQVLTVSRRYHAGAIVVSSLDPVWQDSSSWVWKSRPVFAEENARVFRPADLQPVEKSSLQ